MSDTKSPAVQQYKREFAAGTAFLMTAGIYGALFDPTQGPVKINKTTSKGTRIYVHLKPTHANYRAWIASAVQQSHTSTGVENKKS